MIYKAYLFQAGEGCDYTIGCAQTVISIEASCMEEAKQKLTLKILEDYSHWEVRLESAELYEISNVLDVPVAEIYAEQERREGQEKQRQKEEDERKKYEELKRKFG